MLNRFVFLVVVACSFLGFAEAEDVSEGFIAEGSEESSLELLIQAQEQSAKKLRSLLQYLRQFRNQEEKCIQDPDNLEELYKLSEFALLVKKTIKECYVEPYFRQSFLDDLEKISITAEKRTPPPISKR